MSRPRASARAAKRRDTFRRTAQPTDPRTRLTLLLVVFGVVGAGLIAFLVDLQAVRPDRYVDYGDSLRIRNREIEGTRGAVVDRNGFVLASSTPSHQIVADPTLGLDLEIQPEVTAAYLAPILGMESGALTELLTPEFEGDRYSLLARNVDDELVAQIQNIARSDDSGDALKSIFIVPEEDRIYPGGSMARGIIGRVDDDENGLTGIEKMFDEQMTGLAGTEQYERGRFGSISVGSWVSDPATAGSNVRLTIDQRIQFKAEQILMRYCEDTGSHKLTAAMADPMTGELLAMASVSRNDDEECYVPSLNTAVVDTFEPGSVMKSLVLAAVTEEMGITADYTVDVPPRVTVGGKLFIDHPVHESAPYPVSQILSDSMNVGTILLAQKLEPNVLYDYLVDFGLGSPSELGLEGESRGSLRHYDDWYGADLGSIPIGQGVTVNALQLLGAYNTIANGGTFRLPTLAAAIDRTDGTSESLVSPEERQVLSPETTQEVIRSMKAVVADGTGKKAAIDGYNVAGKTGTAWKVFDDGSGKLGYGSDGNRRYLLTFVGFLPAENPQVSLVIVVDEPEGDVTAGQLAAPIFSELGAFAAHTLGVTPNEAVRDTETKVRGTPAGPAKKWGNDVSENASP